MTVVAEINVFLFCLFVIEYTFVLHLTVQRRTNQFASVLTGKYETENANPK